MLTFEPSLNLGIGDLSEFRVNMMLEESKLNGYVIHSLMLPCREKEVIEEIDSAVLTRCGIFVLRAELRDSLRFAKELKLANV